MYNINDLSILDIILNLSSMIDILTKLGDKNEL